MTKSEISQTAPAPSPQELRAHPVVRDYTLLCLGALFLLVVSLVDCGLGWWSLMPALIGGLALLLQWSLGPPLVIVSLTALLLVGSYYRRRYPYWAREQVPTVMDLLLCVAVLAYVIGHYRLLSLVRHVFPMDSRRPSNENEPARRRSVDSVDAWEMALLLLALPVWTGLSVVVWSWVMETEPPLEMSVKIWRTLQLTWAGLTVVTGTAVVARYVRWTTATPQESLLFLQDQLWRSTRREQSILNRWLVWARLRAQRKREKP